MYSFVDISGAKQRLKIPVYLNVVRRLTLKFAISQPNDCIGKISPSIAIIL